MHPAASAYTLHYEDQLTADLIESQMKSSFCFWPSRIADPIISITAHPDRCTLVIINASIMNSMTGFILACVMRVKKEN